MRRDDAQLVLHAEVRADLRRAAEGGEVGGGAHGDADQCRHRAVSLSSVRHTCRSFRVPAWAARRQVRMQTAVDSACRTSHTECTVGGCVEGARRREREVAAMAGAIAGNGEAAPAARALTRVLLALGAVALVFLGAIYLFAPEIYLDTLMLQPSTADSRPLVVTVFLVAVVLWIVLLGVGIGRRWHWVFWLLAVACPFSALQIPAPVLGLAGLLTVEVAG